MNILIINSFYYPKIIGGAEISVKILAEELYKKGNEVTILCTGLQDKLEVINGVKVQRININNVYNPNKEEKTYKANYLMYRILDIYNPFNIKKIRKYIQEINPNIVHINNIYGLSSCVINICNKLNIPIVYTLRDYYLLCPKINMIKNNNICENPNLLCKAYRKNFEIITQSINLITAPSNATMNTFVDNGFFGNIKKKVIYNAIDYDEEYVNTINSIKTNNSKKSIINFVYLGALTEVKGIKVLIESFLEYKSDNIRLTIAGDGPLKNYVNENLKKDKRIKYLGFIGKDEMDKLLEEMDVLIVPSIWKEPFGRVVIDAYKHSLPVIGSDIGGISEIIDNGKTGRLIKPNDKNSLKEAISFYENNNFISQIKNTIQKLKDFAVDKQVNDFLDCYYEILKVNNEDSI